MNTTVRMKASGITKDWHVIDAAGRPLGRVATEAATLLRGKHKPTFEPHLDGGDFVIVVNAAKVRVSGNKANTMMYYRHSGYPGGLKSRTFEEQLERFPDRVIERAVHGMLPKGSLGQQMRKHLKVYAGPDHPHQAQVTGSEKAQARREEEGALIARVPGKLTSRPTQQSRETAGTATEVEEPASARADDDPAAAPAPAARATRAAEAAEPAAETDTAPAEATVSDAGPSATKPTRRRASKKDQAEDSEE
jgi:large subunit ribosomal protein L13